MTLPFDPGDDLADVADDLQAVSVTRPGSSTTTEVPHALRRAVRAYEVRKSQGQYTTNDVAWHMPVSELPEAPRLGDEVVDTGGRRWSVLAVQRAALGGGWRCICRGMTIADGLDQYVDFQKAVYTKGDGGAVETTWRSWKTGVAARIQPAATEMQDEHDRRTSAARFTVFVAEDVTVDHTHRIQGPDGTIYRILGSRRVDRLDAVMEIDVIEAV